MVEENKKKNKKQILIYVIVLILVFVVILIFNLDGEGEITDPKEPQCHPSYSGKCLNPKASDYDCAGGDGNGPYYTGKVRVIGPDVFKLDRNGDGWGCE